MVRDRDLSLNGMDSLRHIFSLFKKRLQYGIYFFVGFFAVAVLVHYQLTSALDMFFLRQALAWRSDWLTYIMQFFTLLGYAETIAVLGIIIAFILFIRRRWDAFVVLLIALGSASAFTWFTKLLIARPRPLEVFAVMPEPSFALPSGHALIGLVFYGLIAYLVCKSVSQKAIQNTTLMIAAVLILGTGLSRIYLGVHWFTDVVAGYLAGASLLLLFIGLLEFLKPVDQN